MEAIPGIKYAKDSRGNNCVRINLDMYGENQLLEDFLDLIEIESRRDDETISLDEFNRYIDKRVEMNV
jgi:hypothetical protein